ncbi:hypothetical protein PFICI_02525 [Pestalotiopsis fici W106-1]|uniref:Uncharacterized protein n=1 Tax=Pestalotiopsis fici (strain W106-1 / CGMCC3.15140) TaxID=1229662 RepID=W3XEM3_PESFW|nr:uncharacterized protein PFICI_02525 [Pestalotiopsis fici W106-1]ETS84500.1 hypothetical protein PFICI_02525 [Pestalotiopsis fici W106-1]
MYSCGTIIAKRRRDEDCDGGRGYSHESSTNGSACYSPKSLHKRHRASIIDIQDYNGHMETADEMMMDIYEPLSPPLSEPETLSIPTTKQSKPFDAILATTPLSQHLLPEGLYNEIGFPSSIPNLISHIIEPRDQTSITPGTTYRNVKLAIEAIAHHVGPQSSSEIKTDALIVLRDVAAIILDARPTHQSLEVKAAFERDDCIPQLMLQILQTMSTEDIARLSQETTHGSNFASLLRAAHEKAVENYVAGFYDFSLVLEAIR